MMRTWNFTAIAAALFATTMGAPANATVLTFSGAGSSNADLKDHPSGLGYGSNLAVGDDSAEFITTGASGATPDVALLWGPATANVLEFHNASTWIAPLVAPGVLQFDVDISQQTSLPDDPTVDFTVPAGVSVVIESLIIGNATDQAVTTTEPPYAWTIDLIRLTDNQTVFTHTTSVFGTVTAAGGSEVVNINYTGDPGVGYRLLFTDGGANTPRGAIDNLTFSQIGSPVPEPSTLLLGVLSGMTLTFGRKR